MRVLPNDSAAYFDEYHLFSTQLARRFSRNRRLFEPSFWGLFQSCRGFFNDEFTD